MNRVLNCKIYGKFSSFLIIFLLSFSAYAQNYTLINAQGLDGEELDCIAIDSNDENVVFLGTKRGLYRKDMAVKEPWKFIQGLCGGTCRVNQIIFSDSKKEAYIASEKGLYALNLDTLASENIFTRSNSYEQDCLSVCVLEGDDAIFVGTKGGLFFKKNQENNWSKIGSPLGSEAIISLYSEGNIIYAAIGSGVYKSDDFGRRWDKVFNVYSRQDSLVNAVLDSQSDDEENGMDQIKYITGLKGNPSILYVVISRGISVTEDAGKNWTQLPSAGLDAASLKFFLVFGPSNNLITLTNTGTYKLENNKWEFLVTANNCQQIIQRGNNLLLLTSKDVFEYPLDIGKNSNRANNISMKSQDEINELFKNEPTIKEVQQEAIKYAEVDPEKITKWRNQAAKKALLPQVSMGIDRNSADLWHWEGGSTTRTDDDTLRRGRDSVDWDVSLTWDLGELIWNADQTSIDSRSKLLVELRNDILSEVTRLYFERRKLQLEMLSKNEKAVQKELDKELRLQELTALLDRLTGGYFSSAMKK